MSDHIDLILKQPNINVKQARWLAMLIEFYNDIRYIKGKDNKVAYALSRRV